MEVSLRGLGDAQTECIAAKLRDPIPGAPANPTCTPEEVAIFVKWKAGVAEDTARHAAADAVNPAMAMVGFLAWGSPSTQLHMLFNATPRPPLLYYVGAAIPLVALYFLFGGKKK